MGRQVAIVFALLAALGVLAVAMAWSTAARGDEPEKPENVQRVERAATELPSFKRAAADEVKSNRTAATKALARCEDSGPGTTATRPSSRSGIRCGG